MTLYIQTVQVCLMVYKLMFNGLKVTSPKKAVDMEIIDSVNGTKSYTNVQLMGSFSGDVTVTI